MLLVNAKDEQVYLNSYVFSQQKVIKQKYKDSLNKLRKEFCVQKLSRRITNLKEDILEQMEQKQVISAEIDNCDKNKQKSSTEVFDDIIRHRHWKSDVQIENEAFIRKNHEHSEDLSIEKKDIEEKIETINSLENKEIDGVMLKIVSYDLALKSIGKRKVWVISKRDNESLFPSYELVHHSFHFIKAQEDEYYFFVDFSEYVENLEKKLYEVQQKLDSCREQTKIDMQRIEEYITTFHQKKILKEQQRLEKCSETIDCLRQKFISTKHEIEKLEQSKKEKEKALFDWKKQQIAKLQKSKNIYLWKPNRERLITWLLQDVGATYIEKNNYIYKMLKKEKEKIFLERITPSQFHRSIIEP